LNQRVVSIGPQSNSHTFILIDEYPPLALAARHAEGVDIPRNYPRKADETGE
jgi:hypothetical protein